ncbi:MAG: hypothetical protein IKP51_01700 [Treponema sp.]|nr:hypothetical protein [Treponema sp.]
MDFFMIAELPCNSAGCKAAIHGSLLFGKKEKHKYFFHGTIKPPHKRPQVIAGLTGNCLAKAPAIFKTTST